MADKKVSDLPSLNGADVDPADLLYIVDSSAGAAGSKKITVGQYQLAPVSGGTANTVVYLNGSKVESSSSALTFDGTNFATTGTSSAAKLIPTGGTATGNGMYLPAANTLAWSNNGAETMRLDSSGNLGLGVTPSAWSGIGKTLQVNTGGSFSADTANAYFAANSYYNGTNWIYQTTNNATRYTMASNSHIWYTAPSGTAGNAISFTQAMTLDSSGNLGLGVTPSAWGGGFRALQIYGRSSIASDNANRLWLNSDCYNNGTNWLYGASGVQVSQYRVWNGEHAWFTAPSGTAGNAITFTQAMTLSASSELNIDSGTGGGRLTFTPGNTNNTISSTTTGFSGYNILRYRGTQHQWLDSAGTQAMTLDASGNLLVGTTTASALVSAETASSTTSIGFFQNTAATPTVRGLTVSFSNATGTNTSSADAFQVRTAGAERATIRGNGGFANYQANDANLSDERLKTDIQPAASYLDKICAIPVKTFLYKDQTDTERNLGVIAQDVDAVAPELVDRTGFGDPPEGESPYLAIYQTDLQYALMKCIQEQQELIKDLRARVAALEAK